MKAMTIAMRVSAERGHVLCVPCCEDTASHAVAHPGCPAASRGVRDHPVVVGTRLAAHRPLQRLCRLQEVVEGCRERTSRPGEEITGAAQMPESGAIAKDTPRGYSMAGLESRHV